MFSVVHIHLAINHSPLYTETFAFFLLLIGLMRRNRTLITTGLVVTIVAALCAIGADLSGDGAADFVKHVRPPLADVDTKAIDPHDEAAGIFLTAACITGGVALIGLWMGRNHRERPRWMEFVVMILIAASIALVVRVALLGGRIHHPEVRAVVQG